MATTKRKPAKKKTATKRTPLSGTKTKTKTARLSGVKGGKNNMTKQDIVDFSAKKAGLTQKDTKAVIDAFMETIKEVTTSGGYITLASFGTFKQVSRKGFTRKASAKQKKIFGKDTIKVPASKKMTFTASKS